MTIGIVGGMGSFATLNFFKEYLELFKAEKEWDRPRIIIDNRCTMPSRVRAILYNENYDEVVYEIADSIKNLLNSGCDQIILTCGTSHVFLDDVYKIVPEAQSVVLNIIENCAQYAMEKGVTKDDDISLLATEGSIKSEIYQSIFSKYGLSVTKPMDECLAKFRMLIEAVKTNDYSETIFSEFIHLLNQQESNIVILGCTEFPVLYNKIDKSKLRKDLIILDPLMTTLLELHRIYLNENLKGDSEL